MPTENPIVEPAITEWPIKETYLKLDMGAISTIMGELDKRVWNNNASYSALQEEFLLLHGKSRIAWISDRADKLNNAFISAQKWNFDDLINQLRLKGLINKWDHVAWGSTVMTAETIATPPVTATKLPWGMRPGNSNPVNNVVAKSGQVIGDSVEAALITRLPGLVRKANID